MAEASTFQSTKCIASQKLERSQTATCHIHSSENELSAGSNLKAMWQLGILVRSSADALVLHANGGAGGIFNNTALYVCLPVRMDGNNSFMYFKLVHTYRLFWIVRTDATVENLQVARCEVYCNLRC
jgi:hypothetical protein